MVHFYFLTDNFQISNFKSRPIHFVKVYLHFSIILPKSIEPIYMFLYMWFGFMAGTLKMLQKNLQDIPKSVYINIKVKTVTAQYRQTDNKNPCF